MSIVNDLREVRAGVASQVRSATAAARRTSAIVVTLRVLVLVALTVASALVLPADFLQSRWALALGALLLGAALWPRTAFVDTAIGLLAGLYAILSWSDGGSPLWRVALLAAALYTAHCAAAFAAVLPHDVAVAAAASGRWAARVVVVLVASVGLGTVGMALVGGLVVTPTVLAPIAGMLVAAGLAGILAWLAHRGAAAPPTAPASSPVAPPATPDSTVLPPAPRPAAPRDDPRDHGVGRVV